MLFKKLLIFIIIILIAILGYLGYNILHEMQKDKMPEIIEQPEGPPITGSIINNIKLKKFEQITSRPITGLVIAQDKLKYFDKLTGHIYEASLDGTEEQKIISSDIPNLKNALWDTTAQKAIIQTQTKQYYYDFNTNQVILIDFQDPIWCNNKVIYKCEQGICETEPDFEKAKIILKTAIQDYNLVCDNNIAYFYQKPSAKAPSIVYQIKPLKKVLGPEYGLIFQSPNNYSVGTKPHNTIASKCIADYCAVPRDISGIWPDDYYKNLITTQDVFYNIKTKQEVFKTSLDAENLILFNNNIYFTDKTSDYLYTIRLGL